MYNINNKYYKYLEKLYQNNNYKHNDNLFKIILTKEKNLKKILKLLDIKGKIKNIQIKENIKIKFTINNKEENLLINIDDNIKISTKQKSISITHQTLYEKVLSKIKGKAIKKYIKQLQTPITDEHIGLIITKKEKKYINKIVQNKKFINSINNNEFYSKNKNTIHIILNKYLMYNENKEISKYLYKRGYTYKNIKYKKISDIILKMFETLKEKYTYKELYKLINIYGIDTKLIAQKEEIKQMKFPYYYSKKKYIEFDNQKYYVYIGWYSCDYVDLKFRINNLKDDKVDYSIIKI